jgi:UDPglucose 6-dehydrogenase
MTDRISVIGLDTLGLGLALSFARAGLRTVGVDDRPDHIADLRRGVSPVVEPGYQDALTASGSRFLATMSVEEALRETDVTFLMTGTPSDTGNGFPSREVEAAAREAGRALRQSRKASHLFVISSTQTPGTTERRIIPAIEEASGRLLNRGFSVCYAPASAAVGSVLQGLANPELVMIGESAPGAGQRVAALYARIIASRPAISRMSIVSAEMARVSLNAFLTLKAAFANTVANLCEAIPGADVDQITRAIWADRRVSPDDLVGGTPSAGACSPYDTHAFRLVCEHLGEDSALMSAVAMSHEWQHARLAGLTLALAPAGGRIAILGMAVAPGTPAIRDSAGSRLARALAEAGRDVITFDRLTPSGEQQALAGSIRVAATAADALAGAAVVVLALADPEYLRAAASWRPSEPATLVDCRRALDGATLDGLVTRIALGRATRGLDDHALAA